MLPPLAVPAGSAALPGERSCFWTLALIPVGLFILLGGIQNLDILPIQLNFPGAR